MQILNVLQSVQSFEYAADALPLSHLCAPGAMTAMAAALKCRRYAVAMPPPSVGPVTAMDPPGAAFEGGNITLDGGKSVPLRFVFIEPRRVVIGWVGGQAAAGAVFDALGRAVGSSGSDVVPLPPSDTHLYASEITAQFSGPIIGLMLASAGRALARLAGEDPEDITAWGLYARRVSGDPEFDGDIGLAMPNRSFRIVPRLGTKLSQNIYLSSAPFPADAHASLLDALDRCLSPHPGGGKP